VENLNGRGHVEDLDIDGRIILECILGKLCGNMWITLRWLRIGAGGGLL